VWEVIRPRGTLGPKVETQLRLALARRLVILSTSGIVDARELRRQAIEHFMLGRQRNKTVKETFWLARR
jgi:hypothetical protein